jgi:hypothetical protein
MKKRTLLVGLCTAASGTGALLGSGAFTSVSAGRDVRIGIDTDGAALLEFEANGSIDAVAINNGELVIASEFAFNTDSEVAIGSTNDGFGEGSVTTEAFTVRHNFDTEESGPTTKSVTIDASGISGPGTLTFVVGSTRIANDDSHGNAGTTTFSLDSDETKQIAIEIEPDSSSGQFGSGSDDLQFEVTDP